MNLRKPAFSRRQALAFAVAAPLAAAPRSPSGMRFGLTSYQWGSDWDIPTLIANCTRAKALGLEIRTSAKHRHGVEPDIDASRRREVKRMFADSPVKLIGIASPVRFDSPQAAELAAAVESGKAHIKLASDVGASGVRVFPNAFHPEVPQQKTIDQIARSVNELGRFAADYGQQVRLENHGSAGRLITLAAIFKQVEAKNVVIKLNGDARDTADGGFAANFALIQDRLGDTLHMHELSDPKFPYQLQFDLLARRRWRGWCLVERSDKVPDRVQALIEERARFERMVAEAESKA
ncbi:MAG: sugar phosphate isomerase/epimerase family protein [Bryobacteraceae bacterium]